MSHELQYVLTSPAIIPDFRAKRTVIQSQIALALDCHFCIGLYQFRRKLYEGEINVFERAMHWNQNLFGNADQKRAKIKYFRDSCD